MNDIEVVVVDNESTDDSVEVAREFGAKIVSIAKSSFTYGRALNLGLREATSEICVILSAHSLPLGVSFIRECLKPFENKMVAAVRCVYAGKGADLTRWMEPQMLDLSADFVSKGPLASGCAIRRKVWEEIPFNEEAVAAEEKIWAEAILKTGYSIYSPCPAFYAYMKKMSPLMALQKNYRELLEIYRWTGARVGFTNRNTMGSITDFAIGVLYAAPRAAINVVREEALKAYFRYSFLKQAKKRRKPGSLT